MDDQNKLSPGNETDKSNNNFQGFYNINSFRGNFSDLLKCRYKKEIKLLSPRILRHKNEKENQQENDNPDSKKTSVNQVAKPRLLTGKLPSAFDVRYKRNKSDLSIHENLSPKKVIVTSENPDPSGKKNLNNLNICVTEDNDLKVDYQEKEKILNKQISARHSHKNTKVEIDIQEMEMKQITKPIIVRATSSNSRKQKSSSPKLLDKLYNHQKKNLFDFNTNTSDGKSTENNSHSTINGNIITIKHTNSISKTHDSFFPKIKSLDSDDNECNKHMGKVTAKNKNNSTNNFLIAYANDSSSEKDRIISGKCNKLIYSEKKSYDREILLPQLIEVKLEDGISLSVGYQQNTLGRTKRFFHIPSFELYAIKEIPMTSKSFLSSFREKITEWNSLFKHSKHFVHIFHEFINIPEGYTSLLLEDLPGNSLYEIIENTGSFKEQSILQLAFQLIEILVMYNEKTGKDYGEFCLCDIFYDRVGNVKLIPNFLKQFITTESKCFCLHNAKNVSKLFHGKISKISKKENSSNNYMSKVSEEKNENCLSQCFCMGNVLLSCALGGMKFKSSDIIDLALSSPVNDYQNCCLLHFIFSFEKEFPKGNLLMYTYLKKRKLSDSFVDFLCKALCLKNCHTGKDVEIILSSHYWLKSKCSQIAELQLGITMKELMKIMRENKGIITQNFNSKNNQKFENILNNFEIIMSNHKSMINLEEYVAMIKSKKSVIRELCEEIGVNKNQLFTTLLLKLNCINKK